MRGFRWLLTHFEEFFSALLIMIMSTFAFGNVISRYLVSLPLNFTEELNVYFFVWLAFLGSAWAARRGSHMSVALIYDVFPKGVRRVLYILIQAVTVLFFLALAYCGYLEVCDEIVLNAMTETLVIPVWYFTSSIPIGSLLIVVRTIQKTREDFRNRAY